MKAIVQDKYGSPDDVLQLREIDKPVVEDDEVLVRVRAASVHPDVWHVLTGLPYVLRMMGAGLRKPKNPVPGTDVAGLVESVGKNVTRFQPGDEVFGETIRGHQWTNGGAYAEYATAPEYALALKPANVTFEQAAAVPTSALIALPALRAGGEDSGGAEGPGQWCRGWRGCRRRAACQGVRSGRDRRGQHEQAGHGPLDRRGPGD